jgi:hypothetical protein
LPTNPTKPEPIAWDPIEPESALDNHSVAGESRQLESALEQIPPAIQEALQQHLMGTFVRVRKEDDRDFLFAEAKADDSVSGDESELIVEDTEERD